MFENTKVATSFPLDVNRWNLVYVAVGASAIVTAITLAMYGVEKQGIIKWLDATGRTGVITFIAAFIASPLHQLFPSFLSRWLLGNRRFLGIAFGCQHLVFHLPAVIWFCAIAKVPIDAIVTGGLGFIFLIPMLITSFNAPKQWIGSLRWKILHKTGIFYLMFVFLMSFYPGISGNPSFSQPYLINYAVFELALLVAVSLRVAAFIKTVWQL